MAMDALRRVGLLRRPGGRGEAQAGQGRKRARRAPTRVVSATGSLVVHAILIAALATIVWRTTSAPTIGGREVAIAYDALAFSETPAPAAAGNATGAPPRPREVAITMEPAAAPADEPEPVVVELPSLATMSAPERQAAPSASEPGDRSGPEFAPAVGSGGATAAAGADAAATENGGVMFAGLGASNARSVVYVVDASGSMVTSLPLVIAEVERSVSRLSATQKFGVVLFRRPPGSGSGGGVEVFAPLLVRATPSARERLHEWLVAAEPAGRSVPLAGLERALEYKPDAVFLLSRSIERSGGWDAGGRGLAATLARIDQLNPEIGGGRRAVVIQTIQFLDDDPTGTMQEIGRLHGSRVDATGRRIAGYRVIGRGEELGGGR